VIGDGAVIGRDVHRATSRRAGRLTAAGKRVMPKGAGLDDILDLPRAFAFLAPYPVLRIFPFDTGLYDGHSGLPGSSRKLS
jgi:hypothetical protein